MTVHYKNSALRDPMLTLSLLEGVIEETYRRIGVEKDVDTYVKLANSLGMGVTRLLNGHRLLAILTGQFDSLDAALKELGALDFDND